MENKKSEQPKKNNPVDEIFDIIDKYRNEYDVTQQQAQEKTENINEIQPTAFNSHFLNNEESVNVKQNIVNIENHLTSSEKENLPIISEIAENNTETEENIEKPLRTSKRSLSDEDMEKSLPIRILKKVYLFFWNMGFLLKAAIYIGFILITAAFLSFNVIKIGNDVFAFVKSEKEIVINVPENATANEIAFLLNKNDIIEYKWAFKLFLLYQFDDINEIEFLSGEHTLKPSMNYSQIIAELTTVSYTLEQVVIVIPEGYTVDQIIELFLYHGIGTREGYVEAINNYPYRHEFVTELEKTGYSEYRKYRLEGYLYPDTYYFYKTSPEYLVINKMLNNFTVKFWNGFKTELEADTDKAGMTFDQVVTLASMIQAEARLYIDFECVSYVFRNRFLNNPQTYPNLESDATIQYILDKRKIDLTAEDLKIDNPYNTYVYPGLPPGAICNPGYDALSAAIYPDKPFNENDVAIDAFYFVSNNAGKTYYAANNAGHEINKAKVKKDNEALAQNDD